MRRPWRTCGILLISFALCFAWGFYVKTGNFHLDMFLAVAGGAVLGGGGATLARLLEDPAS